MRYIFIVLFLSAFAYPLQAQEQKKLSLNLMAGAVLMNNNEKLAPSGLPENIFGGFKKIMPAAGIGINYRLSEKMHLFENVSAFHSTKTNFGFSFPSFKTGLKYNLVSPDKRFSPFVMARVDMGLVFLNRAQNSRDVFPDSSASSLGPGIGATKITYNEEKLKLSAVPLPGASAGAGFDFKLSPKFSVFLLYSFSHNIAKHSKLLKDNYFYNKSNINYSFVSAGITMRIFKKTRQLIATLPMEKWEGDNTASIKGISIYKKADASKKPELVEMTNRKDSTLKVIPTDKDGLFKIPNLPRDDYKFYLAKRNRKIEKADLELIHDNRMKLTDDYLSLELFDDQESENFISREGNYSVVLREGFQHEINLSITGLSINGKLDNVVPDTSCQKIQLLLYDKKDSLIKSVTPRPDCSFHFTDLTPGAYRMAFRNTDPENKVSFTYNFTGAEPVVSRQFNNLSPKLTYMIAGVVSLKDSAGTTKDVLVKLIDPVSKVVKDTVLTQNGKFHFDNLPSNKYTVIYEPDPKIQGEVDYMMDDNERTYHKEFTFVFGPIAHDSSGKITASGKLKTLKPDHSYVYLINKDNEIVAKIHPEPDGKFSFTHLPSKDYKVVYQLEDTSRKAKIDYNFTDENGIEEETYVLHATGTKDVKVKHKIKSNITHTEPTTKIERYNVTSFNQLESGKTY
ncbi:MAG: collagen binding domain-containing protein, partial [Cytophagaceae bacterium]